MILWLRRQSFSYTDLLFAGREKKSPFLIPRDKHVVFQAQEIANAIVAPL